MLTKLKSDGAVSTAGSSVKKGNKGRLELTAEQGSDGFGLSFFDFGNYGRLRWAANFGQLDREELVSVRDALTDLIEGRVASTHVPFEAAVVEATTEAEAELTPPDDELPAVTDDTIVVSAETETSEATQPTA